jgi:hypothetical protein
MMKKIYIVFICLLIFISVFAEENGKVKILFKGPVKIRDFSSAGYRNRYKDDTWKVNYKEYLYKRFHPMRHEKYPYVYPKLPAPGEMYTFPGRHKDRFSGKRVIFSCRLFPVPEKALKASSIKIYGKEVKAPDWGGYDVIRVDIKTTRDMLIWWGIIDMKIQPPIVGNFNLKPGKWHTLEIDLEQAEKERKLDLSNMSAMWMYAGPDGGGEIADFRLEKRGIKPKYTILRDPEALKVPEEPEKESPPALDIKPDLSVLKESKIIVFNTLGEARVFNANSRGHSNCTAAVFDKNHICLIYTQRYKRHYPSASTDFYKYRPYNEFFAAQTLDGGNTWKGLGDDKKPTHIIIDRATHFKLIDNRGDIVEWNQNGCQSGPAGPWHRLRKYTFTGSKGWVRWDKDRVLDEEARHCTHGKMDFVRTPDGRIWGALGIEGRWYPDVANTHAKYSDTDGKHWFSWDKGFTARIPEMKNQGVAGIAPYKGYVAVITNRPSLLTWYDGEKWAKPLPFPTKYIRSMTSVGKNNEYIIVATYAKEGVVRWDGNEWKTEIAARMNICKSGNSLMGFEPGKKGGLSVYYRPENGKWTGPEKIDLEPFVDICIPRFCPPNLGAVVYVPKENPKQIKVLMIPNKLYK